MWTRYASRYASSVRWCRSIRRTTTTLVTNAPASATTLTRTPSALRAVHIDSVTEPDQPDEQRGEQREGGVGQQRSDDVFVHTNHREDLPDDDGGDDPDRCAQHPGREVGAEQIQRRRATAPRDRQRDRTAPQDQRSEAASIGPTPSGAPDGRQPHDSEPRYTTKPHQALRDTALGVFNES